MTLGKQHGLKEVSAHYHHLGGSSPYNDLTFEQRDALSQQLGIPVFCGFRNWPPWYSDGWQSLIEAGCQRVGLLVLAPHQCSRSWEDYLNEAEAAWNELDPATRPEIAGVVPPMAGTDYYTEANANLIEQVWQDWDQDRRDACELILCAHAIPVPAEKRSPYRQQIIDDAATIAQLVKHPEHHVGFQSAPDDSRIPWSSPKVEEIIEELAERGCKEIVLQSIGFLVDHVEVVFDLDTEAKELAEELGIALHRAPCVHAHDRFITGLAQSVRDTFNTTAVEV